MGQANTPLSSTLNLRRDKNNNAIQAITPNTTSCVNVAISGSSASDALPVGAEVVRLASSGNCYFVFGIGSAPTATTSNMLFPTGVEVINVPAGATHFAVIQEGAATGTFSLTAVD